ncbi:response regulator transcription factor [Halobacillus naozhouensis]|uniref:Response regulator transcription factor n=1 Tax=Halobacillus naozhouensis TaxID=554880 RepID=A0ABY8J0G8_9BACI|nr:response regulator transcription factor [Halobacillus naozhouensis]WFT75992.1 response regulator transcription factor [Halobacillus naozhouensis]
MIKIVIADDHQVVRKGLVFFFQTQDDIEVVYEAANGKEIIHYLEDHPADVVLMDIQMPLMDGIEATTQLRKQFPAIKIVMLTSFSDYDTVIPAIQAGANGYQMKDIEPDQLADVIRRVHKDETMIDAKAATQLMTHVTGDHQREEEKRLQDLTRREKDVLKEIMKGCSNKEIADHLFITEKTVKTHLSNIFSKLEVHDRTQAALFGVKYMK